MKNLKGTSGKRIEWLDIAKGYGIILVVTGHCCRFNGILFDIIFSFHMPLFFFLSGYCYKRKGIWEQAKNKMKSLIVPYCIFFLLGLLLTMLIPSWQTGLSFKGILKDIILGYPVNVNNSSLWFLICLFWVCILFEILSCASAPVMALSVLVLYMAGIFNALHAGWLCGMNPLPMDIDVVPEALLFYYIGDLFRKYNVIEKIFAAKTDLYFCFFASGIGLIVCYLFNGYVNMHGLSFGNPLLYPVQGMMGILMILSVSIQTERIPSDLVRRIKETLILLGRDSLPIMGLQGLLVRLYALFFRSFFNEELIYCDFSPVHTIPCVLVTICTCEIIIMASNKVRRSELLSENRKREKS